MNKKYKLILIVTISVFFLYVILINPNLWLLKFTPEALEIPNHVKVFHEQKEKYVSSRVKEYIAMCYPDLELINKETLSAKEMDNYLNMKKKLGGNLADFTNMLFDRFETEYKEYSQDSIEFPKVECQSLSKDLIDTKSIANKI